jgi:FMN phosphatase YigB (HAD superfamily)
VVTAPSAPRGLLLDFGGVLADDSAPPSGRAAPVVTRLTELVGDLVPAERIAEDLAAARSAYTDWRNGLGRTRFPVELSHAEFIGDFLAADWPASARAVVVAEATPLTYLMVDRGQRWRLKDGVADLLALAASAGIPAAVVSNTLCGGPMRDFLAAQGLTDRFAAQFYSDEAGLRKPNPELVRLAADAIGVPPADCWFVGDQVRRDILACRRAGVGLAILLADPPRPPVPGVWVTPDLTVTSMTEVHDLLRQALETRS